MENQMDKRVEHEMEARVLSSTEVYLEHVFGM